MNTEELYKLKHSVKKELIPLVDELITLRELRERIEYENQRLRNENQILIGFNKAILHTIDVLSGVNNENN